MLTPYRLPTGEPCVRAYVVACCRRCRHDRADGGVDRDEPVGVDEHRWSHTGGRSKCSASCGVVMTKTSRIPASISVDKG